MACTCLGYRASSVLYRFFEKPGIRKFPKAFVVQPVIHAFVVSQQNIHIRGIGGIFIGKNLVLSAWMNQAAFQTGTAVRLIKPAEQYGKKSHIISQRHLSGYAMTLPQGFAQATVIGAVAVVFFLFSALAGSQ